MPWTRFPITHRIPPLPTPGPEDQAADHAAPPKPAPTEIGGPKEAEPTRYGDWTVKGRCIDF